MPLALLTAPDEGRIQGQGDRRGRRCRLSRERRPQVLADLERAGAQGLGVAPGIDRQKVFEHAGGDPVGHAGGKLRPDLVELGRRAAMRRPAEPSLRPAAAGAAEAGQPERDLPNRVAIWWGR